MKPLIALAGVALLLAACQPAPDPELVGSRYVRACSNSSYMIVQLKNGELVISSSTEPQWESEIVRVARGANIDQACSTWPFTGRRHYH